MPTSSPWTVTLLGHSCVLVEVPGAAATVRILLDPGSLSPPLAQVGRLDAVLVTHAHPDHVDPDQVRRLREDAAVTVFGPAAAIKALADAGLEDLIGGRLYAPGDSFAPAGGPVEVLLLPLAGPWMKLAEAVDYLRAVAPEAAVLVHDAGLADAHRALHRGVVSRFAPDRTRVLELGLNESAEV